MCSSFVHFSPLLKYLAILSPSPSLPLSLSLSLSLSHRFLCPLVGCLTLSSVHLHFGVCELHRAGLRPRPPTGPPTGPPACRLPAPTSIASSSSTTARARRAPWASGSSMAAAMPPRPPVIETQGFEVEGPSVRVLPSASACPSVRLIVVFVRLAQRPVFRSSTAVGKPPNLSDSVCRLLVIDVLRA